MSTDRPKNIHYELDIAGVQIECRFSFEETPEYFSSWLKGPLEGEKGITIPESFWESWIRDIGPRNAYNEYSAFSSIVSQALLEYDRCLIHAVALRFRDKAWLICAPSGVGKSTLAKAFQDRYPGEFGIISGDRPALEKTETGFLVHPSPWNGKEGWRGAASAPLAGIVCLERGDVNRVERLSTKKAAAPLYASVIQNADREKDIRKVASFTEAILKKVPVYKLMSSHAPDSCCIFYDSILKTEAA